MKQTKHEILQSELINNMGNLNEKEVLNSVKTRLEMGEDPLYIIEGCQEGMRIVGHFYNKRKYYLAGLIMAGKILSQVIEIVEPVLKEKIREKDKQTRVLIGTVSGDIHDLGKNIFTVLLSCYGFSVLDLGVDVPVEEFLQKAEEYKPDIIGLSGILFSSHDIMKDLKTKFEIRFPNNNTPIIIGGSQINEDVAEYVGTQYWCKDAIDGVHICQHLLGQK